MVLGRPRGSELAARLLAAALFALPAAAVHGQSADGSNASSELTDALPRPGYQQRTWRFGSTSVATQMAVEARYDSNVFAVSRKPIDDFIAIITPRIQVDGVYDNLKLHGQIFADIREYASNGSENHAGFGIAATGSYDIDSRNTLVAGARGERFTESRNDPEANVRRTLTPRQINAASGQIGYTLERNHFTFSADAEIQHYDYLQREDAERSLSSLQASFRAGLVVTPTIAVFVRPFVNVRNYDLAFDSTGINRDATTLGLIGGIKLSGTGRWSGSAGVGAFRSNPDDPSLRTFSGVAANADLAWSPRRRTVIKLRAFSGDVATVRAGAIGRADTRVGVSLDQEVRHNLLFNASAGYAEVRYRGLPNVLHTASVSAQLEYLLDNVFGVFVDTSYTRRRANPTTDSFNRAYVGIGFRIRH